MTRRLTAALAAVLLLVVATGYFVARRAGGHGVGPGTLLPRRDLVDTVAPAGVRIRVQVLNATRTRGLARRAMLHLRDRGFDVVELGTTRERRDSTLVLDRSGQPEYARLVGMALGGAPVEARPDSSRYLDVTVLLGGDWRPPPKPFYP